MTFTRNWTDAEDATLARYINMGATYAEISALMPGRSLQAVTKRARKFFVDPELSHSRWTRELDAALRKMWKDGVTGRDIARKLGFNETTVRSRVIKLGLHQRDPRIGTGREGIRTASHAYETAKARKVRNDTIRFEEHYCATAERRGWPIRGYAA